MKHMKKWQVEGRLKTTKGKADIGNLLPLILSNRGIRTKKDADAFLNPEPGKVTPSSVGIDKIQLTKAKKRIRKAIGTGEKIIIYGDYDVDGICASAILWETLNSLGANVLPYIPNRFDEGYGLSIEGIDNLLKTGKVDLIITVDNGIVATEAVDYADKKGIGVIITDHHVPSQKLPKAQSIVHSTQVCGAAVAYLLASILEKEQGDHLSLVALATVADLVPLIGANRSLLKSGLSKIRRTRRAGLLALFAKAQIEPRNIGVYEIGHIIAPRLNAMGRLESAMDSLRLVCTNNKKRAGDLAQKLSQTNLERQRITLEALNHAKDKLKKKEIKNLIFIADESYQQGIIGLVAGRMVEEYYLPSIVISKGKKYSKASARSIKGFDIIEFLRQASDLLVDVGGHPMAAGFTVETSKLGILQKRLYDNVKKLFKKTDLERILRIDCELPPDLLNQDTYSKIQTLAPFGMGNPEPVFLTRDLIVRNFRFVGSDGKHLKISFGAEDPAFLIEGIYFGAGGSGKFTAGGKADVVYTLDENEWKGTKRLQLKIRDIKHFEDPKPAY